METKELKFQIPDGFEIDEKNSTFKKIIFKKIEQKKWRDDSNARVEGYCIIANSEIFYYDGKNMPDNHNVFATEKQAKSALAMARISQIIVNDKRFGGPITEAEWANQDIVKFVITRDCINNQIISSVASRAYRFLAFHEMLQASLFKKENMDLIKDYYMIS